MKKNFFVIALVLSVGTGFTTVLNAQIFEFPCIPGWPKICFNNEKPVPNSPMIIDGQVSDWEKLLGPGTNNINYPYSPPPLSALNWFLDGGSSGDLDHPEPSRDLRFFSELCDRYNFHFYFRRISNSNIENGFFYFFDVNGDGFMGEGEPVITAHFNSKLISGLSLGKYVPDIIHDYVEGKGNYMKALPTAPVGIRGFADGYTIKGSVDELFTAASIPANLSLLAGEVFAAAITENGYGVEFSVPKRFFKNWATQASYNTYAFYHVALQNGAGPYKADKILDNAGVYDKYARIQKAEVSTLVPRLSYRYKLFFENLTNLRIEVAIAEVIFKNIQNIEGLTVDSTAFSVTSYTPGSSFQYGYGSFENQPITFYSIFPILISIEPYDSVFATIDIHLPSNHSVKSTSVEFSPGVFVYVDILSNEELDRYCGAGGGGGKAINPVGFDINTEEPVSNSNKSKSEEDINDRDHSLDLRIYPNPSAGTATVILPAITGQFNIDLEDISGRIIQRWSSVRPGSIQLRNLKRGFYLLKVTSGETGKRMAKKIIVQ
jgi:hypothetical protein